MKINQFLAAGCVFVFFAVLAGFAVAAPANNSFSSVTNITHPIPQILSNFEGDHHSESISPFPTQANLQNFEKKGLFARCVSNGILENSLLMQKPVINSHFFTKQMECWMATKTLTDDLYGEITTTLEQAIKNNPKNLLAVYLYLMLELEYKKTVDKDRYQQALDILIDSTDPWPLQDSDPSYVEAEVEHSITPQIVRIPIILYHTEKSGRFQKDEAKELMQMFNNSMDSDNSLDNCQNLISDTMNRTLDKNSNAGQIGRVKQSRMNQYKETLTHYHENFCNWLEQNLPAS